MSEAGGQRSYRALLVWLAAMLAGVAVVWQSSFLNDISFFLPTRPTAEQRLLVDQMRNGAVARLLMLRIEAPDLHQAARLSRALATDLASRAEFVLVQNGESARRDADMEFLLQHRYALSPALNPQRFSTEGLRAAIGETIDALSSPFGLLLKKSLTRDPTGELLAIVSALDPGQGPASADGVWVSRNGRDAVVLVQTAARGSDTDGQALAVELVHARFDEIKQKEASAATLTVSGPGVFAVKSRATIKSEVQRLSALSLGGVILVLALAYRSFRQLALGLLPVLSAALAGIVAVSLVFGSVFGITVGFGAALIGEAVDYSTYYFVQSGRHGVVAWRRQYWPTIRLGAATSIVGFGVLLFSGFPGLAQLGLYALSGVAAAVLVTYTVLPALGRPRPVAPGLRKLGAGMTALAGMMRRWRWLALACALAAATYLVSQRDVLWNNDISVLSTTRSEDVQVDQDLRADLGAPDSRYLIAVQGNDLETALQASEGVANRLDRLVETGVISGYDSPSRFLPSQAMQALRRASLPTSDELGRRLTAATADLPIAAARLQPFVLDVEAARQAAPLSRETLAGTSFALLVDSMLSQHDQGWTLIMPLHPGGDGGIPAQAVRGALEGSKARFIDLKGELDSVYTQYLREAMLLSAAGLVAIVLLLLAKLKSVRRLATVLLPLLLSIVLVVAGLKLIGERLNLLHLVGVLLTFAVGSNYSLFFEQIARQDTPDNDAIASIVLAAITTVIGFGALALSSVPVLHAIGVTVGPGALLALLLSAMFIGLRRE